MVDAAGRRGRPPRRHGAEGAEGTGSAVDTETPPDPVSTRMEYPAQRRREDTWPPPVGGSAASGTPAHRPYPPDASGPPGRAPMPPYGTDAPHGGPRPHEDRSYDNQPTDTWPALPAHAPTPGQPPTDGAPAPRAGTGPIRRTHGVTGPIGTAPPPPGPGAPDQVPPTGPRGTAVGDIEPLGAADPSGPDLDRPDPSSGAELTEDVADEADDDLEIDSDDADTASGWALVRASQAGDTAAFGQLFDRYHEVVFRFVLFRLGDRTAAEDLTQETFVRAFRRITSVSYQGRDIGAWFVTIARNLVLDHVKSSRYRLESSTPEIADVAPSSTRPGPEHEVIAGATHAELLRCVARLGDDQQECITLRFLQGLSVAETAEIMGRNEGAVKALQHRAVRRLAQLLPEGLR